MRFLTNLKHRIGYAVRLAYLALATAGAHSAQAAVNYLVLNVSYQINHTYDCCSSSWTDTATATLSISTTCSAAGVNSANIVYYGASPILQDLPWTSGTTYTARSCLAGVPSSITLTPVPWTGNTATPQTLTLGGASFVFPLDNSVFPPTGTSQSYGGSILLPDGRLFGFGIGATSYAGLNWPIAFIGAQQPTTSYYQGTQHGTVNWGSNPGPFAISNKPYPVFGSLSPNSPNFIPIYVLGF